MTEGGAGMTERGAGMTEGVHGRNSEVCRTDLAWMDTGCT